MYYSFFMQGGKNYCLCHSSTSLSPLLLDLTPLVITHTDLLAYNITDTKDILYNEVCFIPCVHNHTCIFMS